MIVLFVASSLVNADLELNQAPPLALLAGDVGGRLDGTSWNSSELKGVVHILMYVDPDKIKVNEHVEEALAREQYPSEKIGSVAITNLAATWKPKFLITKILKRKQKNIPVRLMLQTRVKFWLSVGGCLIIVIMCWCLAPMGICYSIKAEHCQE